MASCSGSLVKILLTLFNLILLSIGCFITFLGWSSFSGDGNYENYKQIIDFNFKTGAIILMGLGVIIVLIAGIGTLGACCESTTLLNLYGFIILFLIIGELVLFYFSFKEKDEFITKLNTGFQTSLQSFKQDEKIAYGLQTLQKWLQCCGYKGPDDYTNLDDQLPASCCREQVPLNDPRKTCSRNQLVFEKGCKNSPFIEHILGSVTYAAYALILVQIIIILAACCLSRDLRALY